jgi:hypothetical protein
MGATALGHHSLAIIYLVTASMLCCPGWSTMPFAVQGFKLAETTGETVTRVAKWAFAIVLICLFIAVPVTLYLQYDLGAIRTSGTWMKMLSYFPGDNIVAMKQQLRAQGTLELSESLGCFGRLANIRPDWGLVLAFATTFAMAVTFAACRLRFSWWPLHPVVFVFLCGGQATWMAWSFLIGWAVKASVTRYGGAKTYEKLKPLMVGVIAGDLSGLFLPMAVGIIYYAITGQKPV